MINKFEAYVSLRKKYRRLALAALLIFVMVSAVLHFAMGSILAALDFNPPPQAPSIDPNVTILTISRLSEEQRKFFPLQTESRKVVLRTATQLFKHPEVIRRDVSRVDPSATASVVAQAHTTSILFTGVLKHRHPGRTSLSEVAAPFGSSQASTSSNSNDTSGAASGENQGFPGRQSPTGAVWTDNGPPGQNASAGGILMSGGGGHGGGLGGDHDGCTPSRGDFF